MTQPTMVTAVQNLNQVAPSTKTLESRPVDFDSRNTDQEKLRQISKAPSAQSLADKQPNIFVRFWNWLKSWFSFKAERPVSQEVSGEKIELSKTHTHVKPFERVEVYDGLITIDEMQDLTKKYIVVFSDNATRIPGLFGQTSVLGPAKKLYPESVMGIPVSAKPVSSYDFKEVKQAAFTENSAEEVQANLKLIEDSLDEAINKARQQNKTILVLRGGYGTGFSRMPIFSPLTFSGMVELFKQKLGISYQLDSVSGRYSLAKSNENQVMTDTEKPVNPEINLWEDPWVVMNHGKPQQAA